MAFPTRRASLLLVVFAIASAAHADLKIVQKNTVDGAPALPGAPTAPAKSGAPTAIVTTTYYKGGFIRTESGTSVTIVDSAKGTVATIDNKKRTYTIEKTDSANAALAQFADFMDIAVDGSIAPTDTSKEIAGRSARKYAGTITMKVSIKEGSPLPIPAGEGPLMTITMETESWTIEGLSVDSKALVRALPPMVAGMAKMMPGFDVFRKKMEAIVGFPVQSAQKISFKSGLPLPGLPEKPMTSKSELVSLSEEALPDSLFAIPSGYKKVEPETPAFPGFGGGD